MNDFPRKTYFEPIREFISVSADQTTDAFNALIRDANAAILAAGGGAPGTDNFVGTFTVAGLPAGTEGQTAHASNGRKIGEGAGAGTGVPVYFSAAAWRVMSTDAPVLA
jgi:hypothetical protein